MCKTNLPKQVRSNQFDTSRPHGIPKTSNLNLDLVFNYFQ